MPSQTGSIDLTAQVAANSDAKDYADEIEVGGRNLFAVSTSSIGYIRSADGVIVYTAANPQHISTDFIPVSPGDQFTMQFWNPNLTNNTTNSNREVYWYDSTKTGLSNESPHGGRPDGTAYWVDTFTAPENAAYVRFGAIRGINNIVDPQIKVKVERGNKPTDWTPAPEDVNSDGVNLLLKSADLDDTNVWKRNAVTSMTKGQADPDGGTGAFLITPSSNAWYLNYNTDKGRLKTIGETYTFSVWLKAASATTCKLCVRYLNSEFVDGTSATATSRKTVNVTTSWQRFTLTGALMTAQTADVAWIGQSTNVAIYAYHPKLEVGSVATEWSPAPRDVIAETHRIYYRTATKYSSGALPAPTAWVTEASARQYEVWSTKVSPITNTGDTDSSVSGFTKYPYLFTCEQRRYADGTLECTKVLLDENTTVIDGGNIITNSVTANRIDADSINASSILKVGSLDLTDSDTSSAISNGPVNDRISYYNRSCQVGNSSNTQGSTNVWRKFASTVISASNIDHSIQFTVQACGNYSDQKKDGVLRAHVRTSGTAGAFQSAQLEWLSRSTGIVLTDFKLVYKSESSKLYVELWCRCPDNWTGYQFFVDFEAKRDEICSEKLWDIYDSWSASGSASTTSGYTAINSTDINAAQSTANSAALRQQTIYIQAASGTTVSTGPTTWVTSTDECVTSDTAGLTPAWSTKPPTYRSNYPVTWVATQKQVMSQSGSTTCTCTTPTRDDTMTVIDGGHITTGTIDANVVNVTNVKAENIGGDYIDASHINTSSLSIGGSTLGAELDSKATPEDIEDAVNAIQIGGTNRLENTKQPTSDAYVQAVGFSRDVKGFAVSYVDDATVLTVSSDNVERYYRFVNALAGNDALVALGMSSTGTYVLSGYVKTSMTSSSSILTVRAEYYQSGWKMPSKYTNLLTGESGADKTYGKIAGNNASDWTKFAIAVTIPDTATPTGFYISLQAWSSTNATGNALTAGDTVSFRRLKFEEGTKATDWSPAPEDVDASIDNIQIGGTNLLAHSLVANQTTTWTRTGEVWQGTAGYGAGLKFPASIFTAGESYVLSFDIQKVSGTLSAIGGHSLGFTTNEFIVDGIATGDDYSSGHTMSDDTNLHHVVVKLKFNGDVSDNNLYIQPNRGAYQSSNGSTFKIRYIKIEKGNKATDWSPASADNGAEYIVGTQTAATNAWTGVTRDAALFTGKNISYKLPVAGNTSAATLNLTLAGGGTTGAKAIKQVYSTSNNAAALGNVTNHWPSGSVIPMAYDGTQWIVQNYNTNIDTINRTKHQNKIRAIAGSGNTVISGRIICGTASGYCNIAAGVAFDLEYPLLYAGSNIAQNGNGDNNYLQINGINASNNGTIDGATQYKMVYLKGTVTNNTFTISASPFMTCNTPSGEDGYCYIPLGMHYDSTTNIYFNSSSQLYCYKDGAFGPVSIREAAAAAKAERKRFITDVTNDGIWVTPEDAKPSNGQAVSTTRGWHIADAIELFHGAASTTSAIIRAWADTVSNTIVPKIRVGLEGSHQLLTPSANTFYINYAKRTEIGSDGLSVYTGATGSEVSVASFGTTSRIGATSGSNLNLDPRNIKLKDEFNNVYFNVQDMRDENGVATLTATFVCNSSDQVTNTFPLSVTVDSDLLGYIQVFHNGDELEEGNEGYEVVVDQTTSLVSVTLNVTVMLFDEIEIIYKTRDIRAKAFTLGYRGSGPIGASSIAEGSGVNASGIYSHAEGIQSTAYGMASHAEGTQTTSSGNGSHAEGDYTQAIGYASHAEGSVTVAKGMASHASGYRTEARGDFQTVIGMCNYPDADKAFIIGNGSVSGNVSGGGYIVQNDNAFSVDWNGVVETAKDSTKNMTLTDCAPYNGIASNTPTCYRKGNVVTLSGTISPKSDVPNGNTVNIGTVAAEFQPARNMYAVCHGSNSNHWLCTVRPDGTVTLARYGTGAAYLTCQAKSSSTNGSWCLLFITYLV